MDSTGLNKCATLSTHAFFLHCHGGDIFTLVRTPAPLHSTQPRSESDLLKSDTVNTVVLIVPPLAEEMNKSRRMFTLLAERLAQINCATTVFDPTGTGDSHGDFADANWETWLSDLGCIVDWLRSQGFERIHLLGLRLGALLAADYLARQSPTAYPEQSRTDVQAKNQTRSTSDFGHVIFWQPVLRGEMMLNQFLRLRLAANMMSGAGPKETTATLREKADSEGFVEIAGYDLSAIMIQQLDGLNLVDLLPTDSPTIEWFEMVAAEGRDLSPASRKLIASLSDKGMHVNAAAVTGDNFWNTQEITSSVELLEQTVKVVADA